MYGLGAGDVSGLTEYLYSQFQTPLFSSSNTQLLEFHVTVSERSLARKLWPELKPCITLTAVADDSIVQCRYVWGSKNSHKSGRSLIHCCWTTSVEQPTSPSMWLWTDFPGVPPVTENAPVLLRTSAPSDCCFRALYVGVSEKREYAIAAYLALCRIFRIF